MRETCKIHFNWVWACVVVYKYVIQFVVMELVLGQSFMVISSIGVLMQKWLPFLIYYWSGFVVVYRLTTLFTNIFTGHCMY